MVICNPWSPIKVSILPNIPTWLISISIGFFDVIDYTDNCWYSQLNIDYVDCSCFFLVDYFDPPHRWVNFDSETWRWGDYFFFEVEHADFSFFRCSNVLYCHWFLMFVDIPDVGLIDWILQSNQDKVLREHYADSSLWEYMIANCY